MAQTKDLIRLATPLIDGEGYARTRLDRVRLFRSSSPLPRQPILYDTWIVANLQGRKTLYFDDRTLQYDENSILCVTSGSPIECMAEATSSQPLIAVVIDLRLDELMGMAARMGGPHRHNMKPSRLVDVFPFTDRLQEAYERLLRALHDPSEASILGEHIVTEIVFRVLQHGLADSLAALAANRNAMPILHATRIINESYSKTISVEDLASHLGMSSSAFHHHFKKITRYSPLQYIKGVRLTKAREMIRGGQVAVNEVAHAVGYESPSQFSREYKRYFDTPPSHDFPGRENSTGENSV